MFFDELTCVSDAEAELKMQPNPFCKYGFLSKGESLQKLIAEDAQMMRNLDIDCERIAQGIEAVFATTGDNWNGHALLRQQYIAGMLCPWQDYLSSNVFSITPEVREIIVVHRERIDQAIEIIGRYPSAPGNLNTDCYGDLVQENAAMILSDLHPHLLRAHGFCQGVHTPYRIAPERVEEYLGHV